MYRVLPRLRWMNPVRSLSSTAAELKTAGNWKEHEFLAVANATLEAISEAVAEAVELDTSPLPDADVELSQGVLTMALGGTHGTYVMNVQTPNRQLWLSSPISGPARYAWHGDARLWCSSRNQHGLIDLLESELEPIIESSLDFDFSVLNEILDKE